MTETPKDKHVGREWEQAWNQYRHIESTRSQYLGFFFTVLVASISVAIGLLKDVKIDDKTTVIFGLLVLAFIVFLITIGLFTAIKKIGYVLRRYEKIMNSVREESDFVSSEAFPFNLAHMRGYPREVLDSGLFSVQRSAEIVLAVGSILLVALLVWLTVFFFISPLEFEGWHKGLGVATAVCAGIYALAVFLPLASSAKRSADQTGNEQ